MKNKKKTYPHMGRVSGAFYDERGAPTAALAAVEAKAAKAAELKAAREVSYPACNSAWSESEGKRELRERVVW